MGDGWPAMYLIKITFAKVTLVRPIGGPTVGKNEEYKPPYMIENCRLCFCLWAFIIQLIACCPFFESSF